MKLVWGKAWPDEHHKILYVGLVNDYFIEGIDLTRYKVVFVIIRGFNRAGLIQAANSNLIYLSLRYPEPGYVNDGS